MAMNRSNYVAQGKQVAQSLVAAGKMQADGIPVNDLNGKPLNMSMNGSWQAVAWKEGFQQVQTEWAAKQRDTLQMKTLRSQAQTRHFKAECGVKQSPRETARKHIEMLRQEATTIFNPKRQGRLFAKAEKLSAKWGL